MLSNNGLCLHAAAEYVLLFVVLAVNSDQFQSLGNYTLLLKPLILTLFACRDCPEGSEMCEVSVGPGATQLSFNPLNWRQLCLMGPGRVTLWTLEQCDTQNLLSPMWVCQLPDIASLVVYWNVYIPTTSMIQVVQMMMMMMMMMMSVMMSVMMTITYFVSWDLLQLPMTVVDEALSIFSFSFILVTVFSLMLFLLDH